VNRRSLIKYVGVSAITAAAVSGGFYFVLRKNGLAANLSPLFDPIFKDAAEDMDPLTVLEALRVSGVIDEHGEIDTSMVVELAKTDKSIAYKGRYYTQTELDLYSLAHLSQRQISALLDQLSSEF